MSKITCISYVGGGAEGEGLCVLRVPLSLSLIPICSPVLCFFFFLSFIFFFPSFAFRKAVSLNPIQFLSACGGFKAPLRGQACRSLSPTSWLFKRAKAQRCSFLNTQIQPRTNRGTAVWQKSTPAPFFLPLSSPWTLTLSPSSLPTLLRRPHYTQILALSLFSPLSYNLSFIASLALTHPLHSYTII